MTATWLNVSSPPCAFMLCTCPGQEGSSLSAQHPPNGSKPTILRRRSLTLVVDEEDGCKVVSQRDIVVGLHVGHTGPRVRDVLFHWFLAHGCMQLPVGRCHLKQKGNGQGGPGTGALPSLAAEKESFLLSQTPRPHWRMFQNVGIEPSKSSCCEHRS